MKDRHAKTSLKMSKQKCMNDLLGERECRNIILSINLNIMTSYISLAWPAHKQARNKTNMLNRFQNDEGLLSSLFEIHSAGE